MTAFQLRTKPEIVAQMEATMHAQLDTDEQEIDLRVSSFLRALIEAAALSDAEQYVQMSKVLKLFARRLCKGEDLDRRGQDFGADVFEDMKRRTAKTSIVGLQIGDGTGIAKALLVDNVAATATSFEIDDATLWPDSGAVVLERDTLREETIVFTRSAFTITVVSPASGVVNPHLATGTVEVISVKSTIQATVSAGGSAAALASGTETEWPASGTIIFERDTVRREARTFTRVGTAITLGGVTTFTHSAGSDVILSTFGSDRPILAGTVAYCPESETSVRTLFRTKTAATLLDGDYSVLAIAESDAAGDETRVGSGTISQWQSEPFANATVTNPNAAVRGRNRESDDAYNQRISDFIQSLSRATALAIETLVAGKEDPFSSLQIAFAQTVEPVAPGEAQLYITDGTPTFGIDFQVFDGRDVLIRDARPNDRRARLNQYAPFKKVATPVNERTPRIFKSYERGVATDTGLNYVEDSTKAWTVNEHAGSWVKADDNQFYEVLSNTAIRLTVDANATTPSLGSYSIFDLAVDPLEPDVDYTFNMSNGDLELVTPLVEHDGLVAASDGALASVGAYTYSRGLGAYAQRLVNGDRTALEDFPGIKALGTQCLVVAPTVITPTIVIQVVTASGLADADLKATVQSIVQSYVNSLGIGQAILISEITKLVKATPGVYDCKVLSPTSNVTVPDGQMARMNASDVQVV